MTQDSLAPAGTNANRVLVVGVYLADKPNLIEHITDHLGRAERYQVTQRWVALGSQPHSPHLNAVTASTESAPSPKIPLINKLISSEDLDRFEYVMICDDDVILPVQFVDLFLDLQAELGFSLAQPARTRASFIDHSIVRQRPELLARQTMFVESGPIVSIHRSAFGLLLPFDQESPMGWGLENVWAERISAQNLKMGIIDACPIEHRLRPPHCYYDQTAAAYGKARLLGAHPHLHDNACHVVLNALPLEESHQLRPSNRGAGPGSRTLPFGVNIAGYLSSEKGVGEAARSSLRDLEYLRTPIAVDNLLDAESQNDDELLARYSSGHPYSINLIHLTADATTKFVALYERKYFEGRYNIGYWPWELSVFPQRWQQSFRFFDEIWTPSEFCRTAIADASPIPVFTIPHSIVAPSMNTNEPHRRRDFGIPDDVFMFLFTMDFSSRMERKNPLGLLKAFALAFGDSKAAVLVLKCSRATYYSQDYERLKAATAGLNVIIIDAVMSRSEIESLFEVTDCYVSLHRTEGFGLTMAEAMIRGKPVIATGYSGNVDYMSVENSFLVDYSLVEIQQTITPYDRGNVWAEPSVDHAAQLMRFVLENRQQAALIAKRGQESVRRQLHSRAISQLVANRLANIARLQNRSSYNSVLKDSESHVASLGEIDTDCSIIIPVCNNAVFTQQCIDTMLQIGFGELTCELILSDDGSTDWTSHFQHIYDGKIKFVRQRSHQGFASACNAGASASSGKYLVFLNNHAIPTKGWLDSLVRYADAHPEVAAVGCKLLFPNDTVRHAGIAIGEDRLPFYIFTGFPSNDRAVNQARYCQAADGKCLLVNRKAFDGVGGFDTGFVNVYQDVDLCLRLGLSGYKIGYCPESTLYCFETPLSEVKYLEERRDRERFLKHWWHHVVPDAVAVSSRQ